MAAIRARTWIRRFSSTSTRVIRANQLTGWQDSRYDAMLAEANSTIDPAERLRKQAECQRHLLRFMPIMPLCYNTWSILQKPFVRGQQDDESGQQQQHGASLGAARTGR